MFFLRNAETVLCRQFLTAENYLCLCLIHSWWMNPGLFFSLEGVYISTGVPALRSDSRPWLLREQCQGKKQSVLQHDSKGSFTSFLGPRPQHKLGLHGNCLHFVKAKVHGTQGCPQLLDIYPIRNNPEIGCCSCVVEQVGSAVLPRWELCVPCSHPCAAWRGMENNTVTCSRRTSLFVGEVPLESTSVWSWSLLAASAMCYVLVP